MADSGHAKHDLVQALAGYVTSSSRSKRKGSPVGSHPACSLSVLGNLLTAEDRAALRGQTLLRFVETHAVGTLVVHKGKSKKNHGNSLVALAPGAPLPPQARQQRQRQRQQKQQPPKQPRGGSVDQRGQQQALVTALAEYVSMAPYVEAVGGRALCLSQLGERISSIERSALNGLTLRKFIAKHAARTLAIHGLSHDNPYISLRTGKRKRDVDYGNGDGFAGHWNAAAEQGELGPDPQAAAVMPLQQQQQFTPPWRRQPQAGGGPPVAAAAQQHQQQQCRPSLAGMPHRNLAPGTEYELHMRADFTAHLAAPGASLPAALMAEGGPGRWRRGGAVVEQRGQELCLEAHAEDQGLASMRELLPGSLRGALDSALLARPHTQLADVAIDEGRDVALTFTDGSRAVLRGTQVDMDAALHALRAGMQRMGSGGGQGAPPGGGGGRHSGSGGDDEEHGGRPSKRRRTAGAGGSSPRTRGRNDDDDDGYDRLLSDGLLDGDGYDGGAIRSGDRSEGEVSCGGGGYCDQVQVATAAAAAAAGGGRFGGGADAAAVALRALAPGGDNRICPPRSLHRISAMRAPDGSVYGLTYRIGRHVAGVAHILADVLAGLAGQAPWSGADDMPAGAGAMPAGVPSTAAPVGSLLLLGRPGSGKTTLLRDIARLLADGMNRNVVVVDTSAEIAGGSTQPHACIGSARRLMVPSRPRLHEVMLEAVQNHTPDVIIVDEIADRAEVEAARTIAQRGVMLVATAHGTELRALLHNPDLNPLVGGLQAVTLGDEEAARTNGGHKTRTERRGAPTFNALVEVLGSASYRVHTDVAASVDELLGLPQGGGRLALPHLAKQCGGAAAPGSSFVVHGSGSSEAPGPGLAHMQVAFGGRAAGYQQQGGTAAAAVCTRTQLRRFVTLPGEQHARMVLVAA